jgi:serine/threonine protein phosphatase PrpC
MKFSVYQISRKGGRELNEDRLGYTYTREAVLLVLADGMGGHPQGEKAAEIAVQVFAQRFVALAKPRLEDVPGFLEETLYIANQAIVDYALEQALDDNPRTTLVAAVLQDGQLYAVHSGDSRLYWTRSGHLVRRTRDHSYQENAELLKHAPPHVNRSVLFTCLGSPSRPLFDALGPQVLQGGDRLLLCSDGLWSVMSDEDVAAGLHGVSLRDAVTLLAEQALRKGGKRGDNVSILALEWETIDDFESTQVITTDTLGDAPYASSFQNVDPSDLIEDFDEDAIERSIAEINEAIRRTAVRKKS